MDELLREVLVSQGMEINLLPPSFYEMAQQGNQLQMVLLPQYHDSPRFGRPLQLNQAIH